MPANLQPLIDEITRATTVDDSVVTFIQGVPALIQTAVDQATANGATAAQLQPVTDLGAALDAKTSAIVTALAAGTTPAPVTAATLKAAVAKAG
jgi:hypothetical protein